MAEDRKGYEQSVMGRPITIERYMKMIAEKTFDNTQQLKRDNRQRRNGMEDLYGVCFSAHATELSSKDNRYHAKFYISLSPDYVYLHRFAFKFVIMPSITEGEDPSEGRDWKVAIGTHKVNDEYVPLDITAYLKEQQDGEWIEGEGIYPNNKLEDEREDFYDILDVVSVMFAEGNDDDANVIIKPNFKPVDISSLKPFSVDAYLYLKYSNCNR